jgi:hypothetical protein
MNNNSAAGILLAFFGGIAAGVAIGYWLNSDKGRKLRTDAAAEMSELEARIESKVKEAFATARRKAEEAVKN